MNSNLISIGVKLALIALTLRPRSGLIRQVPWASFQKQVDMVVVPSRKKILHSNSARILVPNLNYL